MDPGTLQHGGRAVFDTSQRPRNATLAGFQRELWETGTIMNETSFNLAQILRKGKRKRPLARQ